MSYGSLTRANVRFQLAAFAVLLGAFIVALVLINVHPTAAILIFWLGLILLGLFAVSEWLIRKAERAAARKELRAHHCPRCGAEAQLRENAEAGWHCDACGSTFLEGGAET